MTAANCAVSRGDGLLFQRQHRPVVESGSSWSSNARFHMGDRIADPASLRLSDDELFSKIAGKPSRQALLAYHGDFDAYWQNARNNFVGKAHEYEVMMGENRRFEEAGDQRRLISTAAEGASKDPADLLLLDGDSRIIEPFQLKLGRGATVDALRDEKYEGQKIITSKESFKLLVKQKDRAVMKAERRGLKLTGDDALLNQTLEEGRIPSSLITGTPLVNRVELESRMYERYKAYWEDMLRESGEFHSVTAEKSAASIKIFASSRTFAANATVVACYVVEMYQGYSEFCQWDSGSTSGTYFASKMALHSADMALLTIYLAPTGIPGVVVFVASVAVTVADVITDAYFQSSQLREQQLLSSLERSERLLSCRQNLIANLDKSIVELGDPTSK